MHYAHSLIKKENRHKEMNQRAGASGICISQSENVLTLASTGNLLGLIYRKGHLETLISPDSLMKLARDDYSTQFYTCPTSGFGLFDELHLQVQELRAFEDDLIILLSDGVYSRVDHDEIKYILDKREQMSIEKVNELFKLANSRGNLDNQSALFLQY
jgi:serine/threonine protein phosphatase PrpC